MNLQELIRDLCNADYLGDVGSCKEICKRYLSNFGDVSDNGGALQLCFKGNSNKIIMIDAHIDQIGLVVTSVFDDGFLKVSASGGIDARILPATQVKILSSKVLDGVFCSTPPHLAADIEDSPAIEKLRIDTGLPNAKELISPGDMVVFNTDFNVLNGEMVTGKSLDNRAGCAALIMCAEMLKDKRLPINVIISLSDEEELGCRGARTAAFSSDLDMAIAVDVSFGDCPFVESEKTGKLGRGPMIGISPVLSKHIQVGLQQTAKESNIPYQLEVMGGATSTNADVISISKSGVPCGLVSIPLRNMHTPAEVIHLSDIENTAKLMCEFIYTIKGE